MNRLFVVLCVVVTFGLSLSACGDSSNEVDSEAADPGIACFSDVDCPADHWCAIPLGESAVDGVCEPLTPTDTGGGENTGASDECRSDIDCPRGQLCDNGACVLGSGTTGSSNNGTTGTTSMTTTTGTGTSQTSEPECSGDGQCEAFEECCEGACVQRGQCGGGGADECTSDDQCEVFEECCEGACVQRGQCGGGGNTGGGTSGNARAAECQAACNRLVSCSDQICIFPIFDAAECQTTCINDLTINAPAITNSSCTDLNANLCQDETVALTCECGGGSTGTAEDTVCLQDCTSSFDCPGFETCVEVGSNGNMQCVDGENIPAGQPPCSATFECSFGETCFELGGGSGNTGSCSDMLTCFEPCAEGDTACLQACYDGASSQGQSDYNELVDCAEFWCAPEYEASCLSLWCSLEADACGL